MRTTVAAMTAGGLLLSAAAAGHADPKSDALFAKAKTIAAKTQALDTEVSYEMGGQGPSQKLSGTIKALKPNFWDLRVSSADGQLDEHLISNGKTLFNVMEAKKQYMKMGSADASMLGQMGIPALALILSPKSLPKTQGSRYIGTVTGSGKQYDVVKLPAMEGLPPGSSVKVYFGPSGLPEGQEMVMKAGGQTITQKVWLRKINLKPELTEKQFAYTPPADFKLFEQPDLNADLLAVDKEAPDFLLPQPGGGTQLSLSDARKGKKAVLVNFWFYG